MFLKTLLKHGILCLAIVFQICQQRSLFFSFLAVPQANFAQSPHLGMSWKIFALPNLFIKEQYILTSKAPGAEDMTALLEISDNLTVVWEPAFPSVNKEDCDELFTLRSCRHVALPFYKGPTICLLREGGRGGGGVWVIWEKISCRLISNEKKSEKCTWGNVPALKKNIYMLKKILKRLYVGEKILSREVWEKKF